MISKGLVCFCLSQPFVQIKLNQTDEWISVSGEQPWVSPPGSCAELRFPALSAHTAPGVRPDEGLSSTPLQDWPFQPQKQHDPFHSAAALSPFFSSSSPVPMEGGSGLLPHMPAEPVIHKDQSALQGIAAEPGRKQTTSRAGQGGRGRFKMGSGQLSYRGLN